MVVVVVLVVVVVVLALMIMAEAALATRLKLRQPEMLIPTAIVLLPLTRHLVAVRMTPCYPRKPAKRSYRSRTRVKRQGAEDSDCETAWCVNRLS